MTRVGLVFCIVIAACGSSRTAPRPAPLVESLLAVARDARERTRGDDSTRAELDRIAGTVRSALARSPTASPSSVLNATLFGTLGFVREVDDTSLGFVLLPSVLEHRRGSCVGLGSLYLALGERLGWKIRGVMVPGHFFVRIDEAGASHNLELLHRGEVTPDAWYRARFPIPGGAAPEYARTLSTAEVMGVVEYDIGHERQRQGRLLEARRAYECARGHFPAFAEAHASLGAIAHLLGALDEAHADYEAARLANPHLPGIDQNIDLLESERSRRPPL